MGAVPSTGKRRGHESANTAARKTPWMDRVKEAGAKKGLLKRGAPRRPPSSFSTDTESEGASTASCSPAATDAPRPAAVGGWASEETTPAVSPASQDAVISIAPVSPPRAQPARAGAAAWGPSPRLPDSAAQARTAHPPCEDPRPQRPPAPEPDEGQVWVLPGVALPASPSASSPAGSDHTVPSERTTPRPRGSTPPSGRRSGPSPPNVAGSGEPPSRGARGDEVGAGMVPSVLDLPSADSSDDETPTEGAVSAVPCAGGFAGVAPPAASRLGYGPRAQPPAPPAAPVVPPQSLISGRAAPTNLLPAVPGCGVEQESEDGEDPREKGSTASTEVMAQPDWIVLRKPRSGKDKTVWWGPDVPEGDLAPVRTSERGGPMGRRRKMAAPVDVFALPASADVTLEEMTPADDPFQGLWETLQALPQWNSVNSAPPMPPMQDEVPAVNPTQALAQFQATLEGLVAVA